MLEHIKGLPPIPEAPKEEPPTEKQIHFLEKYGEKVPKTKEQASKMIGKIIQLMQEANCYGDIDSIDHDPYVDGYYEDPYWDDHR